LVRCRCRNERWVPASASIKPEKMRFMVSFLLAVAYEQVSVPNSWQILVPANSWFQSLHCAAR
jgi:hypothetical protein